MKDKDKVVNSEEQNRAVNPGDNPYQETPSQEQPINKEKNNPPGADKPEKGSEVENPRRTEEEDPESTERKIPNM